MATEKEQVKLYKGKVVIDFYPNSHRYKMPDSKNYLISVTGALGKIDKPALRHWALNEMHAYLKEQLDNGIMITYAMLEDGKNQSYKKTTEAADIGTMVHEWVEQFIKGNNPPMPTEPKALNGVTAFLQWIDSHKIEFVSTERVIYSRKHDYVGTMDAEAIIDGKLSVIEFKTSKKPWCVACKDQSLCEHSTVYPEWRYQSAAYQRAAKEEGTKYTGLRHIVRFDKEDGHFELTKANDLLKDFYAFLGALQIAKREKELNKR